MPRNKYGIASHKGWAYNASEPTPPGGELRVVTRPRPTSGDQAVLASYPRRSPDGQHGEVRVTLGTYEGHPVLQIRHYVRAQNNDWIATPRGVSIPAGEIDAVVAALGRAKLLMSPPSSPGRGEPRVMRGLPTTKEDGRPFHSHADSGLRDVAPWEATA